MASCSDIAIKSISGGKVYLKGTITGLSVFKRYCLHHSYWGWKNIALSGRDYTYMFGVAYFDLERAGCYIPTSELVEGGQFEVACHEVARTCESITAQACTKTMKYDVSVQKDVDFGVRDIETGGSVANAKITCGGKTFYTDSEGNAVGSFNVGLMYFAICTAPTGYKCTDCSNTFLLTSTKYINFWMKKIVADPCAGKVCNQKCFGNDLYTTTCMNGKCVKDTLVEANSSKCGYVPKPGCTEGDKKPDKICVGGKWEDALCAEGTYTADRKKICRGGVWEDVSAEEPEVPPAPECTEGYTKPGYVCSGGKWVPVGMPPDVAPEYLTAAEATERFRIGLPCYIKCVLPILDMLPGIPYTPGAWIPPFCAITTEA